MKTVQMEAALNSIAKAFFGRERNEESCVCCGSPDVSPIHFRDDLSRREFQISRFCQKCQDSAFNSEE